MENQQYDEAVDISSSESVDEADVAPPPKPTQVTGAPGLCGFRMRALTPPLCLLQVATMGGSATSGSGGGSASGSGGGSARGGGGSGGAQQGTQSAHIGSGEDDEGNSETSSDDDEVTSGVKLRIRIAIEQ